MQISPDQGQSEEYTAIARCYWQIAGVANKIDLRLVPALDTLNNLLSAEHSGTFDFVFIDADKISYSHYYEKSLALLRPGGLIAIDNVLWGGDVADLDITDPNTLALRSLNQTLHQDNCIELSMLPIASGCPVLTPVHRRRLAGPGGCSRPRYGSGSIAGGPAGDDAVGYGLTSQHD